MYFCIKQAVLVVKYQNDEKTTFIVAYCGNRSTIIV